MSVTDLSQKAIANLGWDKIRLTAPVFAGDTIYAESEVLDKRESSIAPDARHRHRAHDRKEGGRTVFMTFERSFLIAEARPCGGRCRWLLKKIYIDRRKGMADAELTGDDRQEALMLQSVERFLEREVRPYVHELEHADTYPAAMAEKMAELGLFGATIAPEYGGLGLPALTYARIVERMSAVWMSVPGFFNSHLIMAAAVQRFGTETQKRKWLPRFASGELRGGIALTEPDCGTDLQAIRTTARREGDHYVVNGTKTWISNGIEGQMLALLVKTDPKAPSRATRA